MKPHAAMRLIGWLLLGVMALGLLAAFAVAFNIALTRQPEPQECPAVTLRDQFGNTHIIEPRT